jgi:hypothetical protein
VKILLQTQDELLASKQIDRKYTGTMNCVWRTVANASEGLASLWRGTMPGILAITQQIMIHYFHFVIGINLNHHQSEDHYSAFTRKEVFYNTVCFLASFRFPVLLCQLSGFDSHLRMKMSVYGMFQPISVSSFIRLSLYASRPLHCFPSTSRLELNTCES